jgi:integrase
MAGKQAKILSLNDVNDLLVFADCTRHPLRNRVIVLLATKAALRAGEIAKLTWDMVLDPTGGIGSVIELRDLAAKNGSGRLIPVHPRPSPGPRVLSKSVARRWFSYSIRARRRHDATQYRGLVQSRISQHRS